MDEKSPSLPSLSEDLQHQSSFQLFCGPHVALASATAFTGITPHIIVYLNITLPYVCMEKASVFLWYVPESNRK